MTESHFAQSAQFQGPTAPSDAAAPTSHDAAASPSLRIHAPDHSSTIEAHPTANEQQASAIVDGVLKAAHRLRGLLSAHFAEFDLTDVRYVVLRFLHESEPHGCTQAELAECLDQSESSVSTLVKRMRNSELLYRLRSGIDKRKRVLKLTERGRSLLASVRDCHARRMDELLHAFDMDERQRLAEMITKLVDALSPGEAEMNIGATIVGEPAIPSTDDSAVPAA